MKDNRPVNLNLTTVAFPITAIASILHRISAVAVWVCLGVFLTAIGCALASEENFYAIQNLLMTSFIFKFITWGTLTAAGYHSVATLKHLIQDFGFFEDFEGGKLVSWIALILGGILSIAAGLAICL